MEKLGSCVLGKNQFMKKSIFLAVAIVITASALAQDKKKAPPPPPPPAIVDVKDVPPPPPPPKAPPPPMVKKSDLPDDFKAFLKRNPSVKGLGWMDENKIRVHLKNGMDEVYDMNNEEEATKLKNKYGELPTPPPPPPPPKAPKIRTVS